MKVVLAFAPGPDGTRAARAIAARAAKAAAVSRVEHGCALEGNAPVSTLVEIWGAGAPQLAAAIPTEALHGAWQVEPADPVPSPIPHGETGAVPGLRLVSLCKRIDGIDRASFARHWHGEHRAIALSFAVLPAGYRQDVVSAVLHGPAIDGVAGLHFLSREHVAQRYTAHPEDAARGARDAARFLDVPGSLSFFTSVTVERTDSSSTGGTA